MKAPREALQRELGERVTDKLIETFGEETTYYTEKGVDIAIASDMLRLAYNNSYDTAILITGDGDFVPALEGVQDLGKHTENAYFQKGSSLYLREVCDRFILLDSSLITGGKSWSHFLG